MIAAREIKAAAILAVIILQLILIKYNKLVRPNQEMGAFSS